MHASGDIYIFDEILAVGDESFIKKCLDFFTMLLANKKTIVFITHNLDFVKEHATKILYLHRSGEYSLIESQSEIESFSFTPTISNK
jgi:ABC-type polysaccharide/polyol phosphate transport system ATPase subunit